MLSKGIQELIERHRKILAQKTEEHAETTIHVDEIASKVATFYEKIRNIVDYQEEHLLRKRFIFRTLKRRFFISLDGNIAEALIKEIIRAGHLANDIIPESKIAEVQRIVDSYAVIHDELKTLPKKEQTETQDWITNIAVSTIEEILFPPAKDRALSSFMYQSLRDNLSLRGGSMPDEETNVQLFIAVQRALLRVDRAQLHFRLFKLLHPGWHTYTPEDAAALVPKLPELRRHIHRVLNHPLSPLFLKLCNVYNTVFYLIGDIAERGASADDLQKTFADEDALERAVKAAYGERYKKLKSVLRRVAFLSVLSFFLSKMTIALIVEIPVEIAMTGGYSFMHAAANIIVPPLLMFIITLAVRPPSGKNYDIALDEVKKVVYENIPLEYRLQIPPRRGFLSQAVVRLVYFCMFFVSFAALYKLLQYFGFNLPSTIIFAFFISLIAATGVKISNRAKEISLEKESASFFAFLLDLITMPFVSVGQLVIAGLTKFNILVILFNVCIELPFQFIVEFLENLRSFIKIKKEEVG